MGIAGGVRNGFRCHASGPSRAVRLPARTFALVSLQLQLPPLITRRTAGGERGSHTSTPRGASLLGLAGPLRSSSTPSRSRSPFALVAGPTSCRAACLTARTFAPPAMNHAVSLTCVEPPSRNGPLPRWAVERLGLRRCRSSSRHSGFAYWTRRLRCSGPLASRYGG